MKVVPTYLEILLDNEIIENDSPEFKLLNNRPEYNQTSIVINIKTAKVQNWDPSYGQQSLWCKAVDTGIYILYNEDMEELDRIEGYVPNNLIPEHDGYGDYIDMTITKSGYVSNWYNHPSLDEFEVDFDMIVREMGQC